MPWMARNAASMYMLFANEHASEPMTKMTIANR